MPDLPVLAVLLLSAFVHGVFGFGFPMVATPLLALMMDMRSAILLTLIPTIFINLVSILGEKHRAEALRLFWPIPTFTIIGSLIGTQVLLSVDPEPFRLLLALMLVAYLLAELLHGVDRERSVPTWGLAALGLSLGLLAGVVNIFGPVIIVFALYTRMRPELMVAAFNLSFITSKSGQLIGFTINDALDTGVLIQALWALPLVLGVLWGGIVLRRRIHPEHYRKLLRFGLWVMAAALIWDTLRGI
ncbi:MAG: sulfite exporter TauE/SafE family protein [Thiohalocapsa sp.]